MRKALIGLLIAATAVTPVASAAAQNWGHRGGHERQQQRSGRGENRMEHRAQGGERRGGNAWQGRQQNFERRAHAPRSAQRFERRAAEPRALQRFERRGAMQRDWQERRAARIADRSRNRAISYDRSPARIRTYESSDRRDGGWNNHGSYDRNWNDGRQGDRNWSRGDRDWNRGDRNWSRGDRNWDRSRRSHNWSRNWRNDRRYDWQRYRYSNRHLYRMGRYYSPYRGYGYRRFSIGLFLEPLFFGSRYWISDPWYYRLPPAYPGTRWIRYYDDVLLVDMYSGEVIDVIYDFFW